MYVPPGGWPPLDSAAVGTLLRHAVRLEEAAGSSGLADVDADLAYAARILREAAEQDADTIAFTQQRNRHRAALQGWRRPSGQVERPPGWARRGMR